ncbi:TPA: membrane integrity-associated transporter subunit PqiC [Legionella pneumophila]|nr:membrane integrity-associated transporter subunit PqiC [Legionella pneumophila]HBA1635281.1 membrane integrity-associated transporter subunit PqiC [Legionella pneumophila]
MKNNKRFLKFYCIRDLSWPGNVRDSFIYSSFESITSSPFASYVELRKKPVKFVLILLIALTLCDCGRSKETQFYLLTPIPPQKNSRNFYNHLQIGVDEVSTPDYMKKPQLMIHQTPHHLTLEEFNQWAGALDKNITLVLTTNLSTLMPGVVVQASPWDNKFHPDYHLQVMISQFEIDIHGNSILRAEYLIYRKEELIHKGNAYYHIKVPLISIEALVQSMNTNLTHLTEEIARFFIKNTTK